MTAHASHSNTFSEDTVFLYWKIFMEWKTANLEYYWYLSIGIWHFAI